MRHSLLGVTGHYSDLELRRVSVYCHSISLIRLLGPLIRVNHNATIRVIAAAVRAMTHDA